MPPTRPTAITVIAVLQFVFGGIGLLSFCGDVIQAVAGNKLFTPSFGGPQTQQQQELQQSLQRFIEEILVGPKAIKIGSNLTLSLVMIISGIGLLKMQSWGRMLSILYTLLSILEKVFMAGYTVVVSIPAAQEFVKPIAARGQEGQAMALTMQIMVFGMVVISVLSMTYPIIVLIIMFRPKIVAAFRGEAVLPADQDVDDRYEEDERWGR